jgi:ABC-2 type transport system ATP-binding protein
VIYQGNQKKVGIIATLIEIEVIILDEPFANLDPTSVNRLKKVLKGLKIRTSPSWFQAMFTTHVEVCDRIVALNKGKL